MPAWIKSVFTVFFSAILHVSILLMIIGFPVPDFFGSSAKEFERSRIREFRHEQAALPASCPAPQPLTDGSLATAPVTPAPVPTVTKTTAIKAPKQALRKRAKVAPPAETKTDSEDAAVSATETAAPEQKEPTPAPVAEKEAKVVDVNFADKDKAEPADKTAADSATDTAAAKDETAQKDESQPQAETSTPATEPAPAPTTAEEPKAEDSLKTKEEKPDAKTDSQPAAKPETAAVEQKSEEPKPEIREVKKEEPVAAKETGEELIPVQDKLAGVQPANESDSSTEAASEDLNAPTPDAESSGESN